MKLYDWKVAPNPRRVRVYLAEKGITVPIQSAADETGRKLSPAYLERFPHRRVPILELDDGTIIAESMAICRYFEALHPDPPLLGRTPLEIAMVEMWERRIFLDGAMPIAEALRNKVPAFAGRALPGYDVPIEQIPALVERSAVRLPPFFRQLDQQLSGNRYITGEAFTMADISGLIAVDFGTAIGLPVPDNASHVRRWHAEVSARPSAKA